jgi:hypothetical protein
MKQKNGGKVLPGCGGFRTAVKEDTNFGFHLYAVFKKAGCQFPLT